MIATRQHETPNELQEAVNRYLSERLEASFISTSMAIEAVKSIAPERRGMTTRQLADYIAERAVTAGFVVRFDEREPLR